MVESFTVNEFNEALPKDKEGRQVFEWINLVDAEHCWVYIMPNSKIRLLVRSSINVTGVSASSGEDSIRIIIQRLKDDKWISIGKGPDAYTTRVKGWNERLRLKIKDTWRKANKIKQDFTDDEFVNFSRKGATQGRPFAKNFKTDEFRWLD